MFTQPFIRAQIKVNIKAPRHWPLCGEFTGDRWIPRTNGQLRGKCFHLMTSSWYCHITWHKHITLNAYTWWRHQMASFSALLALCVGNSPLDGESPSQRPVTRSFDVFFLICAWINGLVNNREAGDFRRIRAHYDVVVMNIPQTLDSITIAVSVMVSTRC